MRAPACACEFECECDRECVSVYLLLLAFTKSNHTLLKAAFDGIPFLRGSIDTERMVYIGIRGARKAL